MAVKDEEKKAEILPKLVISFSQVGKKAILSIRTKDKNGKVTNIYDNKEALKKLKKFYPTLTITKT